MKVSTTRIGRLRNLAAWWGHAQAAAEADGIDRVGGKLFSRMGSISSEKRQDSKQRYGGQAKGGHEFNAIVQ